MAKTHVLSTALVVAAGFVASVQAQSISPIGPFTGAWQEVYAGSGNNHVCIPGGILGGNAQHCATRLWYSSSWSFACQITPTVGSMINNYQGHHEITFNEPVLRFGGYFGSNAGTVTGGTIEFYEGMNFIGSEPMELLPLCSWHWSGWEFSVPVTRVVMRTEGRPAGTYLMINILEADLGDPTPVCYANCDGSTTPPILNVDDFTCFINEFAAAQPLPHEQQVTHYANCDSSTTAPVLNVDDFTCFINAFAQGCR